MGIPPIPDLSGLPSSTPNPLAEGALDPQAQPPQQQRGGRLKKMLSNFAEGFGESIAAHNGVPSEDQKQQRQFQNQLQLRQQATAETTANAVADWHKQTNQINAEKVAPVFISPELAAANPTLAPYAGKYVPKLALDFLRPVAAAKIGAESRENVADTAAGAKVNVAKIGAANKTPNEIQLILDANKGDPQATAALGRLQGNRMALAGQRGAMMGMYRVQNVYDPEAGTTTPMFMKDIQDAKANGRNLLSAGPLPASTLIGAQRLNSEAGPAIQQVKSHLGAYDNPSDRSIFARIMQDTAPPENGDIHSWIGRVLDQAGNASLSPEGKNLVISLKRLNETVGLLRSTLGLPATNSATSLTLSMLPGASTPDSKFAAQQMDNLQQVVDQSLHIPGLGSGPKTTPNAPQAGGQIPPAAAALLQEGIPTTFKNGQVWTKKNGQASRLK